MTYGFGIVKEMTAGLSDWMDEKGYASVAEVTGRAVPNVTDWQYLNLNYVTKARIDQDRSASSAAAATPPARTPRHQAIAMKPGRVFEVNDDECVACNLCVDVCPVEDCITMERLAPGDRGSADRAGRQRRLRQLDDPSQQPDGAGGRVGPPCQSRIRVRQAPAHGPRRSRPC